jgi:hypothetical protein
MNMSIFKRGRMYWYKFMWNGELIRESTKQSNDRKARTIEAAHRARLSGQEDARKDACLRLKCAEVLLCSAMNVRSGATATRLGKMGTRFL